MWKTFEITPEGNMRISLKAWSDFAATIPLIRSFSFGSNFPPQYPIFAGPPIRYHFGYYLFVGILERIGLPLDWALNLPSTLGFTFLLTTIYLLSKIVFKSRAVGVLSVILFLFNGSFSFLEFFKSHPVSLSTISEIVNNTAFASFGPYDGKVVSAFWNLNIYTNQRHLALGYLFFIIFLIRFYLSNKNPEKLTIKKSVLLGLILGFFPFIHLSVFLMTGVSLSIFFLLYPRLRKQIFIIGCLALILAIPQYLSMGNSEIKTTLFHPGYLVSPLTVGNFFKYWFLNLGIGVILAPIGFYLATKDQRKILIPFLAFFVIGNLFQFAPDMPTNHKFFNLFIIGLNMFTAYVLIRLWQVKIFGKASVTLLIIILTISGIIDLFPIFNDRHIILIDMPNNKAALFIKNRTPKRSVFLNSQFLYDPASLAGRKIYMGWPYFSWGAGYDTTKRDSVMKKMLNPENLNDACRLLLNAKIDFIETSQPNNLLDTKVNYLFFEKNFGKVYYDAETNYSIYKVIPTCSKNNNVLKR